MVLVDERVRELVERRGVPAVVEGVLVVDLATVDPSLGVDVVEVPPLAVDERGEVGREDTRLGRDGPDGDGVGGDSRSRSAARLRAGRPGGGHYQGCQERRRHQGRSAYGLQPVPRFASHTMLNPPVHIPPRMPLTVPVRRHWIPSPPSVGTTLSTPANHVFFMPARAGQDSSSNGRGPPPTAGVLRTPAHHPGGSLGPLFDVPNSNARNPRHPILGVLSEPTSRSRPRSVPDPPTGPCAVPRRIARGRKGRGRKDH